MVYMVGLVDELRVLTLRKQALLIFLNNSKIVIISGQKMASSVECLNACQHSGPYIKMDLALQFSGFQILCLWCWRCCININHLSFRCVDVETCLIVKYVKVFVFYFMLRWQRSKAKCKTFGK